jgi:hypothetical protein
MRRRGWLLAALLVVAGLDAALAEDERRGPLPGARGGGRAAGETQGGAC